MWNKHLWFALFPDEISSSVKPHLLYWTVLSSPNPILSSSILPSSRLLLLHRHLYQWMTGQSNHPNPPPRSRHRIKAYHSSNLHLTFLLPFSSFFSHFSSSFSSLFFFSSSFLDIFKILAESFHPTGSFVWCSKSFPDDLRTRKYWMVWSQWDSHLIQR